MTDNEQRIAEIRVTAEKWAEPSPLQTAFQSRYAQDVTFLLALLAEKDATIAQLAEAGVVLGEECERISDVATDQAATIRRVRDLADRDQQQSGVLARHIGAALDGQATP